MGFFDKLSNWLGMKKKEANIVVVGLDNSGKSTILNHLKPPETKNHDIVPTVGFNVEKVQTRNLTMSCFDMSGQGRYRNLWEHYYRECHGVIFVVDSSDKLRMVVAKEEFDELLNKGIGSKGKVPILIFANKIDLRDALSSVQVSRALELDQVKDKPWHICGSNALTGEGLNEGFDWLADQLRVVLAQQ